MKKKKHAIIPIFIPHRGCPNDCVFCNQKAITARQSDVTPADAENIIETHLATLEGRGLETIEAAFSEGASQAYKWKSSPRSLLWLKNTRTRGE